MRLGIALLIMNAGILFFGYQAFPIHEANSQTLYNNPLMGIKFSIPLSWNFTAYYGFEKAFCRGVDVDCRLALNPNYELSSYPNVVGLNIEAIRGVIFEKNCNCSSLKEFVRFHYNHIKNDTGFSFINDSKTIIGGNTPAWKIEYSNIDLGESRHVLDTLAIENGTYYLINYYADEVSFPKFLPDTKEMISSIRLIPVRQITNEEIPSYVQDYSPNEPSFLK